MKDLASRDSSTVTAEEAIEIAKKAEIGLDILFMAYAKAENMDLDPDGTATCEAIGDNMLKLILVKH
ncbi:hypothetical protein QUB80_11560 [Chlorogloeopsis sp. ULAP01]|nr:hypothetical protein [Chlorogloeopsis sp. ULAP01]